MSTSKYCNISLFLIKALLSSDVVLETKELRNCRSVNLFLNFVIFYITSNTVAIYFDAVRGPLYICYAIIVYENREIENYCDPTENWSRHNVYHCRVCPLS